MKKAQVWFLDFVVGLLMFMVVVFVYYDYSNNLVDDSETDWDEMIIDSKTMSSSLMSMGYPNNWNETNVQRIGVLNSNYRLNQTKIERFVNMSYDTTKDIFNTRFKYYFFIQDKNDTIYFPAGKFPTDHRYLVQTTRILIYNSSVYRMVLYIWNE
jgi:hypothetical protein